MRRSLSLLAFAAVVACSSDDDGTEAPAGATTACAADTRKDVYAAGMAKPAGGLSVTLVEASPAPPAKGTNAMTIELRDASGAPVDGARIVVVPWMPDHAHGSAVTPVVAAEGAGRYGVSKVYFPMAGLWRVTVTVEAQGQAPQDAVFQFCLEG